MRMCSGYRSERAGFIPVTLSFISTSLRPSHVFLAGPDSQALISATARHSLSDRKRQGILGRECRRVEPPPGVLRRHSAPGCKVASAAPKPGNCQIRQLPSPKGEINKLLYTDGETPYPRIPSRLYLVMSGCYDIKRTGTERMVHRPRTSLFSLAASYSSAAHSGTIAAFPCSTQARSLIHIPIHHALPRALPCDDPSLLYVV